MGRASNTEQDTAILRQLEHDASMNWALAQRAEREGNSRLAETLAAVAAEADRAALVRRKGAAVHF